MRDVAGPCPTMEPDPVDGAWPSSSSAHAFWAMQVAFVRAMDIRPDAVRESRYSFAGRHARLRVVGHRLADYLSRSFDHLQSPGTVSTHPDLTIDVWDGQETGILCPVAAVGS